MDTNNNISRIILNSIYKGCWVEIKYQNRNGEIKTFWITVFDIDFELKKLECYSLSLDTNKDKIKHVSVYMKNIISADILEDTMFEDNEKVIKKLEENISKTKELFPSYDYEKILLYLEECAKLDVTPYKTDVETVWGIDKDILYYKDKHYLTEQQTNILKKNMASHNNKISSFRQLAINILSIIYPNNKQYVLAYLPIKWNILDNSLQKTQEQPLFNPKFSDPHGDFPEEWQISEYLTEDQQELLKDYNETHEEIYEIISKKVNNKNQHISDMADLLFIERNKTLELEKEYDGIRYMYQTNSVTKPISAFFGELELNRPKFKEKGFCFVNNHLNISQILSIFLAFKEDVTFIQGPPGTGKTSTVVNAVTTAFYNKMKILVVTNNNKPMKDLKKKFDDLGYYKNNKIELPVCRLSAKERMDETIISMYNLYHKYKNTRANDEILEKNSNFQSDNLKEIIAKMEEVDDYVKFQRRDKVIKNFVEKTEDYAAQLSLRFQASKRKEPDPIDAKEVNEKVNIAENVIKSFLYFYSAKCIQNLDKEPYAELKEIIDIDISSQIELEKSVEKFVGFIHDPERIELLLDVFPIVLSTNLSSSKLADPKPYFDICIMDEAGQCNVATSLIPIVRAKKLMLVGDVQQLKPVIMLNSSTNESLKTAYDINPNFCYMKNSIYSSMKENAPTQRESLLNEHYRCNEKIIDFCNRKYYQNKLEILSKDKTEIPLEFINIDNESDYTEKNVSLNEVKEVIKLLQREEFKGKSIGIITPYVIQKKVLEKEVRKQIKDVNYDIGTIHTFQGDEKEIIIFSTAISNNTRKRTYNWLKSNKQLINVAVSRSISKLILLANEEALKKLHYKDSDDKIDDIYELYEHIVSKGQCSITPNTIRCEALGTEEEGTIVDKDMFKKIALSLSVITDKSRYKEKVNYQTLLGEEAGIGKFDFVIYNEKPERNLAIQLVKVSQKSSDFDFLKNLCEEKETNLLLIESNEIRSYYSIKDLLKEEMKRK